MVVDAVARPDQLRELAVEGNCAGQVRTERLLHRDAAAGGQANGTESTDRRRELGRGQREVDGDRGAGDGGVGLTAARVEGPHRLGDTDRVAEVDGAVPQAIQQCPAHPSRHVRGVLCQPGRDVIPERLVGPVLWSGPDDVQVVRQLSGGAQPGQCREQETPGQVTGRAEHEQTGDQIGSSGVHGSPAGSRRLE